MIGDLLFTILIFAIFIALVKNSIKSEEVHRNIYTVDTVEGNTVHREAIDIDFDKLVEAPIEWQIPVEQKCCRTCPSFINSLNATLEYG